MQYGYERDEKMRSISRFKRGFGGRYVNEFRGIKYFDQALYQSEAEQFNKAYVANIISGQEQPSEL